MTSYTLPFKDGGLTACTSPGVWRVALYTCTDNRQRGKKRAVLRCS